jgi:uncharacterized membrane protein
LSAGVWGTGDFCGGKASQTSRPLAVTVVSQLLGLPVLVACVLLFGHAGPTAAQLGYGALAGVAGLAGIVLLYQGLAKGSMAVFAPVSAVTAAVIPMIVGLYTQRSPGTLPLIGATCAIIAIGLVSIGGGDRGAKVTPSLIGLALASGAMFGIFFAILGKLGNEPSAWPMVGVRIGSLGVGLALVAATGTSMRLSGVPLRWTAVAGTLDIVANVLYLLAIEHGSTLSIIAPIASLYPVSTVLLALAVDREKIRPVQLAGLGLAATALVLVAT